MFVEFVNPNALEAGAANLEPVTNPGKPFELDDKCAKAYINEGHLRAAEKPKAPAKDKDEAK